MAASAVKTVDTSSDVLPRAELPTVIPVYKFGVLWSCSCHIGCNPTRDSLSPVPAKSSINAPDVRNNGRWNRWLGDMIEKA